MNRVGILISGSGSNMVKLVERLQNPETPGTPVVVAANVPDAPGLAKAAALDIPTICVDHRAFDGDRSAFEAALSSALMRFEPSILCLAGFMRILGGSFLSRWDQGVLNIHPSLLPKYPGLHTHARALAAGDREHGCSVHWVTEALDSGPLLGQGRVPVRTDDTAESLAARVLKMEHRLYPDVLTRVLRGNHGVLHLA